MILFIILGIGYWLGYKSGCYVMEVNNKNTISLNELAGIIVLTLIFPISIVIVVWMFFEKNGNKPIITRK